VAEQAERLVSQGKARYLVLAAETAMLGFLREALSVAGPKHVEVRELAKNLTKQPTLEIHQHLGEAGLLPARRKPTR
jgi:protein required for attachment to host cells